jgi:hypothetical protein
MDFHSHGLKKKTKELLRWGEFKGLKRWRGSKGLKG